MDRRFSWIVLLVSGAFFVFVVGLTGWRVEDTRRSHEAAARQSMRALEDRVVSLAATAGGFESASFKAEMRALFDASPRLLLVAVNSPTEGMLYFIARSRGLLREPRVITPEWRGTPSYAVSRGSQLLLSTPLEADFYDARMDVLYLVAGRDDLYPIVRDDLYLLLAFLLVCGVVILIVMNVAPGEPARPAAQAAAAPAAPAPGPAVGASVETSPVAAASPARSMTSPRSGLVWAEHLEPRLKAELERAAGADQDIACARLAIDGPPAASPAPGAYGGVARILLAAFPAKDLLFEAGGDSYTVVLPDADVDAAVRLVEDVRLKVAQAEIGGRRRTVSAGVSARGGRLIPSRTLLEEADTALAKAVREGGNQVIGFRADPSRYRASLTGKDA